MFRFFACSALWQISASEDPALNWIGSDPSVLTVCQGDCDADGDCPGASKCIQRAQKTDGVEGCSEGDSKTEARKATDYCSNPTAAATDAEAQYVKAGAICAGVPLKKEHGFMTMIGLATGNACTAPPEEYIVLSIGGTAVIKKTDGDATKYLSDDSLLETVTPSGDGYFSKPEGKTEGKLEYATFSFGTEFGDVQERKNFGYLGMASYLVSKGKVEFNENTFNVADSMTKACVSPTKPTGANTDCGPMLEASPGTFKFSLLGYGQGTEYENAMQSMSFFGVRTVIDFSKMGAGAKIMFSIDDSDPKISATKIAAQQITKLEINGAKSELLYEFPQYFNYGLVVDGELKKKGSEKVQIRYSLVDETSFNIDYLFKLTDDGIGKDKGYFVYDPDVKASVADSKTAVADGKTAGDSTTAGGSAATGSTSTTNSNNSSLGSVDAANHVASGFAWSLAAIVLALV